MLSVRTNVYYHCILTLVVVIPKKFRIAEYRMPSGPKGRGIIVILTHFSSEKNYTPDKW